MAIRVEIRSGVATSDKPATVLVYEDDRLIAQVVAEIEHLPGADGGHYPCVILKKQMP